MTNSELSLEESFTSPSPTTCPSQWGKHNLSNHRSPASFSQIRSSGQASWKCFNLYLLIFVFISIDSPVSHSLRGLISGRGWVSGRIVWGFWPRAGTVIGFASANDDYPLLPATYKNQKRFNAFLDSPLSGTWGTCALQTNTSYQSWVLITIPATITT